MWSLTCYDWKPQPSARLIERLERVVVRNGKFLTAGQTTSTPGKHPPAIAGRGEESNHVGEIVVLHDGDASRLGADRRHVLAALDHWLARRRDAHFSAVTMKPRMGRL